MIYLQALICVCLITVSIGLPVLFFACYRHFVSSMNKKNMSFEDVNDVLDSVLMDIWSNKYLLYYRLRDITVIPKMDEEARLITKDVMDALSPEFINYASRYYNTDHITRMIVRKAQVLLIEYLDKHKPSTR